MTELSDEQLVAQLAGVPRLPNEGDGAHAVRAARHLQLPFSLVRRALGLALGGRYFPAMSIVPLPEAGGMRAKLEALGAQARASGELSQLLHHFLLRLRLFDELGVLHDSMAFLMDLPRAPYFSVYVLPDDEFFYLFTIGVHYNFPQLPDLLVAVPQVSPDDALRTRLLATAVGQQLNALVPQLASGEKSLSEGMSALTALDVELSASPPSAAEAPPAREWDWNEASSEQQAHGRALFAARPFNQWFKLDEFEHVGLTGFLDWFARNWCDTEFTPCLAVKLALEKVPGEEVLTQLKEAFEEP